MARSPQWSTVRDVIAALSRRWALGTFLKPYAAGEAFSPVSVAVRGPTADDVSTQPAKVAAWAERFLADASRQPGLTVATKVLRSRALGVNEVPARITISTLGDLARAVGGDHDLETFDRAVELVRAELPAAESWMRAHPVAVVRVGDEWGRIIAAARWVVTTDVSHLDVRHIDAPGVDSKFVETHRAVLRPLLDAVLPPDRIDVGTTDLQQRYGFRRRPTYVRFRTLGNAVGLLDGFTEFEVRVDELALHPLPVSTVIVVENRATFHAFADMADTVLVFGGGYAVTVLDGIGWLADRNLRYWGDIDTHGFRILDRLRQRFGHVESMLMDEATLVANLDRVVSEPTPLSEPLLHLTPAEQRLYRDLVEDRFGVGVRLEQERVSYPL